MTTTTTTTTAKTAAERRPRRPERARRLALAGVLGASALLALVAGGRGADVLGDELGGALGRWAAPPRRHTVERAGLPRVEDDHGLTPGAPVLGGGPAARAAAPSLPLAAGTRTRGVYVPAAVVLAYARRGVVPAVDTRDGVRLRGVGTEAGLADGDTLVSVGSARVRSLREVSGIVTSAVLAGRTELSGVVRRGDDDIAVTVEIPTGAEPPAN